VVPLVTVGLVIAVVQLAGIKIGAVLVLLLALVGRSSSVLLSNL